MKLTIIRTLAPDQCATDADTGRPDNENRQASEPIRVLRRAVSKPQPLNEDDLRCIRKVLTYPLPLKVTHLAPLIGATDEETTKSIIQRGDDYVLNYYVEREWAARKTAWAEDEEQRQASLKFWVFRNKIVRVEDWSTASREEIVTRVKHKVLREEKAFAKLKREIELFEKLENESPPSREPIPEDVRIFVWRRDQGRCVRCGSQERIEFDHIIPIEKGGSNTARNVQVLCERCNREKGTSV